MSKNRAESFDQEQYFDITDNDDFENDDLVKFQHDSKTINFYYSQLTKYSKRIRDEYLFSNVNNLFPQEIREFQEKYQLLPESIDSFFQLLHKNYNIGEDLILTYIQCIDLLKISKFLKVRKLFFNINQYIKSQYIDVDFVVQMIEYEIKMHKETNNYDIGILEEVESSLINKINECLTNEKFKKLPIEIIFRVAKQCSPDSIDSDKLFEIIVSSLSKFCVLFQFLNLQKLSDDRLDELCKMYSKSNESTQHCFDYLKCNLNLINEINDRKKNLEKMNNEQQNKFQGQLDDSKKLIIEQQDKMKEMESKIELLQNRFNDSEKANSELKSQLDESKEKNKEQKDKMKDMESKIELLQNQVNDSNNVNSEQLNKMKDMESKINEKLSKQDEIISKYQIEIEKLQQILKNQEYVMKSYELKGSIIANVDSNQIIRGSINIDGKENILDKISSKYILNTNKSSKLGEQEYENGKNIKSLAQEFSFIQLPGTYYIHAIIYNTIGQFKELISEPLIIKEKPIFKFSYTGNVQSIKLIPGKYLIEVWGAEGGVNNSPVYDGKFSGYSGKGGYSVGTLNLKDETTLYVYVGGSSNSNEGGWNGGGSASKEGAGGGGSTDISLYGNEGSSEWKSDDHLYSRIIVAGGGGGSSNTSYKEWKGRCGGGLNGESNGHGGIHGGSQNKGYQFGLGESNTNKKYLNSGGGGGWYGGYAANFDNWWGHGGGGGSGFVYNSSSASNYPNKCKLNNSFYLENSNSICGNEEIPTILGNGKETGHKGNGFAKITPL